jgi:hypothetical protein
MSKMRYANDMNRTGVVTNQGKQFWGIHRLSGMQNGTTISHLLREWRAAQETNGPHYICCGCNMNFTKNLTKRRSNYLNSIAKKLCVQLLHEEGG